MVDFAFSPAQEAWREEVRAFLDEELPAESAFDIEFSEDEEKWDFALEFSRKVGAKGWIGVSWPVEYGGLGKGAAERFILLEEFARRDAPLVNVIGWDLAGPTLLYGGTEEQKQRFLPGIASMDTFWAEGLTEPDSGSDLASIRTSATPDGDGWIINGQKTYTTWGTRADVLYLAARTDPDSKRHRGISVFCLDLRSDGVTFSPMWNIAGGRQNHTFLDNVRIGPEMLLGEVGRGWDYIMGSFFETGPEGGADTRLESHLEALIAHCRHTPWRDRTKLDDPEVRRRLAELTVLVDVVHVVSREGISDFMHDREPAFAGALLDVVTKEMRPRFAQLCTEIIGPMSQLRRGAPYAPVGGEASEWFLQGFGNHAGGTSQVKRMVMATRGLGLPRESEEREQ